jgi:hypothetical protein
MHEHWVGIHGHLFSMSALHVGAKELSKHRLCIDDEPFWIS